MNREGQLGRRRVLELLGWSSGAIAVVSAESVCAAAGRMEPSGRSQAVGACDERCVGPDESLHTRFTREYGLRYPFACAGMGFVGYPPLVIAVTNAGGLGVLGNGIEPPPSTQLLVRMIKEGTQGPFGVDFIHDQTAFGPAVTDDHIDICASEGVTIVIFHMNVPPRHWVDRLHAGGCRVWQQAASVEQAAEALSVGVDAIVAQGSQAGGHNKSTVRTATLLGRIVREVKPPVVLAAGGIATGADVADALTRGADGVWVGTRMLATTEAYAHEEYKQRLLRAHGRATAVTTAFGPEYPNVPYRVLRTDLVRQVAGHEDRLPPAPPDQSPIGETVLFPFTLRVPYTMPRFSAAVPTPDTTGDFELMGLPAGEESVRKIKDIRPAAEVVEEMMTDAREILAAEAKEIFQSTSTAGRIAGDERSSG